METEGLYWHALAVKWRGQGKWLVQNALEGHAFRLEPYAELSSTFPGAGLISVAVSCSGGFPIRPLASAGAGDTLRLCFLQNKLAHPFSSARCEGSSALGA